MKALVLTTGNTYVLSHKCAIEQLFSLGVDYTFSKVALYTTTAQIQAISADYDCVIIPYVSNNNAYKSFIDNANLTIPIYVLNNSGSLTDYVTNVSANAGVSAGVTLADSFFSSPFFSSNFFAAYGYWVTPTTATPIITAAATDPFTTAVAQANAGKTVMWYATSVGGSRIYFSTMVSPGLPALGLMLQHSYRAGLFSATTMATLRKMPLCMDMDHVTGVDFYQSLTKTKLWSDRIPDKNATVWCGGSYEPYVATMSADVKALLADGKARGKFKFCYHSHVTGTQKLTGIWPYSGRGGTLAASGVTFAQEVTAYNGQKASYDAAGIGFETERSFYVPATNEWDEESLRFLSSEKGISADPANTTVTTGKGAIVLRQVNGTQFVASRPSPRQDLYPQNQQRIKSMARGMMMMIGNDLGAYGGPGKGVAKTVTDWRKRFQSILQALHYGGTVYLHDEDFTGDQTPQIATNENGVLMMDSINQLCSYCSDVIEPFADITNYAIEANRSWAA